MDKEILEQLQLIVQGMSAMEERLNSKMSAMEQRLNQKIEETNRETESRLMLYLENKIERRIDSLFDGYKLTHEKQWELERQNELLNQKLEGLLSRVEALENKIA